MQNKYLIKPDQMRRCMHYFKKLIAFSFSSFDELHEPNSLWLSMQKP